MQFLCQSNFLLCCLWASAQFERRKSAANSLLVAPAHNGLFTDTLITHAFLTFKYQVPSLQKVYSKLYFVLCFFKEHVRLFSLLLQFGQGKWFLTNNYNRFDFTIAIWYIGQAFKRSYKFNRTYCTQYGHSQFNKSVWLLTNTTAASKYRIIINWNSPFQTFFIK